MNEHVAFYNLVGKSRACISNYLFSGAEVVVNRLVHGLELLVSLLRRDA